MVCVQFFFPLSRLVHNSNFHSMYLLRCLCQNLTIQHIIVISFVCVLKRVSPGALSLSLSLSLPFKITKKTVNCFKQLMT